MLRNTKTMLLLMFCALLAVPAFASDRDRVSFAQRIVVREGETVGDVVCFLCTVENHGSVQGDVVSFLGGVKSDGPIHGDVVAFLGDVGLAGEASVAGDLVVMGGSLRKSDDARTGKGQVIFPTAVFLIPFLILGTIAWALVWAFIRIVRRPRVYYTPVR